MGTRVCALEQGGLASRCEWSRTTLYFIWQSVCLDTSHKEELMDGGTEEVEDDALNSRMR